MKNSAGQYVLPTIANTSAAAIGITVPADLGISTINSPARAPTRSSPRRSSSPTRTRARTAASSATAKGLKSFLAYAFGAGQKTLGAGSDQLPYAPLPAALATKDNTQLATMTCNGSPIS